MLGYSAAKKRAMQNALISHVRFLLQAEKKPHNMNP